MTPDEKLSSAAALLGRRGGRAGSSESKSAWWRKLTPEQRQARAVRMARARWDKQKQEDSDNGR